MAETKPTIQTPPKNAEGKKKGEKSAGGKKKMSISVLAYLISTIIFVIGVVICSVNNGAYDKAITLAIYNAAQTNPSFAWLKALGIFVNPDFYSSAFWTQGDMGEIFSFALVVAGVILLIYSAIRYKTPAGRYLKYTIFLLIVGLVFVEGLTDLVKFLWGRARPYEVVSSLAAFTPWYQVNWLHGTTDAFESFYSGHTAFAAFTICLALSFIGAKKKFWAPLFAIGAIVYVVLIALARMAYGAHWFSDTLFGAWIIYTLSMVTYYWILNIPRRERTYVFPT